MNTTHRRLRPNYPVLTGPGDRVLVERDECRMLTRDDTGKRVAVNAFVYSRPITKPGRSRYEPHVGKKQLAKLSPL